MAYPYAITLWHQPGLRPWFDGGISQVSPVFSYSCASTCDTRADISGMNRQPVLQDDWIILTPLRPEEFEELFSVANDPLIWEQHPNPDRWKRDVFRTYFDGALASGGAFMIRDKATGSAIGSSRLYDHDPVASEVKIGYTFFSRDRWGTGTNHRVKRLMMDHAFKEVKYVIFHVGAQNMRSRIAMERLGAELIGEQEVAYFGEPPKTNVVYRMTAPDSNAESGIRNPAPQAT